MACPAFDLLMNKVSPIMITIHAPMVMIVSPEMVSSPPASTTAGIGTTEVNDFVFAPKTSSATFCSR